MNRDELIAAMGVAVPKPKAVEVPAWGGTVYVREMTLLESDRIRAMPQLPPDLSESARGLAAVIVDSDGVLIFDPANLDDVRCIQQQASKALTPLFKAMNEANAAGEEEIEKLGNGLTPEKS